MYIYEIAERIDCYSSWRTLGVYGSKVRAYECFRITRRELPEYDVQIVRRELDVHGSYKLVLYSGGYSEVI